MAHIRWTLALADFYREKFDAWKKRELSGPPVRIELRNGRFEVVS